MTDSDKNPHFEQCLENAARGLCKARGIDPDVLQVYNNGTLAMSRRPAWINAREELRDAWLVNLFVRTLPL